MYFYVGVFMFIFLVINPSINNAKKNQSIVTNVNLSIKLKVDSIE